jgi:hypothetical protein
LGEYHLCVGFGFYVVFDYIVYSLGSFNQTPKINQIYFSFQSKQLILKLFWQLVEQTNDSKNKKL